MNVQVKVVTHCDNQAAILASTGPLPSSKLRHVNVNAHYICEFLREFPEIHYVQSTDNIADLLTKGLDQAKFDLFVDLILAPDNNGTFLRNYQLGGVLIYTSMVI